MKYKIFGNTGLRVSELCLGTMTFGNAWGWGAEKATVQKIFDLYTAKGGNFIDTANLYSNGTSEKYIGELIKSDRDHFVLGTKFTLKDTFDNPPKDPNLSGMHKKNMVRSVEESLKRLQTDYIDLYQLHWPNRPTPHFAKHWLGGTDPKAVDVELERAGMLETLHALDVAIKAGKIREIGLSNDTPWGISEFVHLAQKHNLPKAVSIQNEFSLLHLKDWPYLIENCVLNEVAYMPWSPLAGGALSGKYANGAKPQGCRWSMQQRNGIFRDTSYSHQAIAAFKDIADKHNVSLTQLSLAWVYRLSGVSSTIIGATSIAQLKENIDAHQVVLSDEALAEIASVIKQYPQPF